MEATVIYEWLHIAGLTRWCHEGMIGSNWGFSPVRAPRSNPLHFQAVLPPSSHFHLNLVPEKSTHNHPSCDILCCCTPTNVVVAVCTIIFITIDPTATIEETQCSCKILNIKGMIQLLTKHYQPQQNNSS